MKVSFVIPFHNEEKNISPMIKRVYDFAKSKRWQFEIIPVDDRSSDNTKKILKNLSNKYKFVKPVYRSNDDNTKGNTMGRALIEGTKKASADIVIWTMGDLADDAKTYGAIVGKISEGFDMVFGSRYMPGGSRGNLDPIKAFLSSWGTLLARLLFGIKVHDITNAFRGFRKNIFNNLELTSEGFSISPEFAIKAHFAGFKLAEVPTVYTNRVEGASNFKLYQMAINYLRLYIDLFSKYLLQNKTYEENLL